MFFFECGMINKSTSCVMRVCATPYTSRVIFFSDFLFSHSNRYVLVVSRALICILRWLNEVTFSWILSIRFVILLCGYLHAFSYLFIFWCFFIYLWMFIYILNTIIFTKSTENFSLLCSFLRLIKDFIFRTI